MEKQARTRPRCFQRAGCWKLLQELVFLFTACFFSPDLFPWKNACNLLRITMINPFRLIDQFPKWSRWNERRLWLNVFCLHAVQTCRSVWIRSEKSTVRIVSKKLRRKIIHVECYKLFFSSAGIDCGCYWSRLTYCTRKAVALMWVFIYGALEGLTDENMEYFCVMFC